MAIMITTLLGFSRAIVSSIRSLAASRESSAAAETARRTLEDLAASDFGELWATYNDVAGDDPGGAGTAPGNSFAVPGLAAAPGDVDGVAGRIVWPSMGAELREDLDMPQLGLPRDLNGDGVIDSVDHSGDYTVLPVMIVVEWSGTSGRSKVEFKTVLGESL